MDTHEVSRTIKSMQSREQETPIAFIKPNVFDKAKKMQGSGMGDFLCSSIMQDVFQRWGQASIAALLLFGHVKRLPID